MVPPVYGIRFYAVQKQPVCEFRLLSIYYRYYSEAVRVLSSGSKAGIRRSLCRLIL